MKVLKAGDRSVKSAPGKGSGIMVGPIYNNNQIVNTMKTIGKISVVLALAIGFASCSAGYVVSSRPEPPVYARPASPHAGWIWIDGDYYYRGGRYVHRPGYWTAPRRGYHYQPGNWQQRGNGWSWRKGHWHR